MASNDISIVPLNPYQGIIFAVDENQQRDPQLDNVQRVRDFGAHSSEWNVFIKFLSSGAQGFMCKWDRKIERVEVMDNSKKPVFQI